MRQIEPWTGKPENPHERAAELGSLGLNDRKRLIAESAASLAKDPNGPRIVADGPRIGDVITIGPGDPNAPERDRKVTIVEILNASFDPTGRGDWFAFGLDVFGCVLFNVTTPEEERAPAPMPQ